MVDAGLDDILISYPLIGSAKALRLAELARRAQLRVACDSVSAIDTIGEAASAAKAPDRHSGGIRQRQPAHGCGNGESGVGTGSACPEKSGPAL
jgi:hypothetical protein